MFLLAASSLGGVESMCVAMGMVTWFECMDRPCVISMASSTDAVVVTKLP